MAEPPKHRGKTYIVPGPVKMSQGQIASAVGEVSGRKVSYVSMSLDDYRKRLEKPGTMPELLIQRLCEIAVDYQNGIFAGEHEVIERVTGQAPLTVQAFVKLHPDALSKD